MGYENGRSNYRLKLSVRLGTSLAADLAPHRFNIGGRR